MFGTNNSGGARQHSAVDMAGAHAGRAPLGWRSPYNNPDLEYVYLVRHTSSSCINLSAILHVDSILTSTFSFAAISNCNQSIYQSLCCVYFRALRRHLKAHLSHRSCNQSLPCPLFQAILTCFRYSTLRRSSPQRDDTMKSLECGYIRLTDCVNIHHDEMMPRIYFSVCIFDLLVVCVGVCK